MKESMLRLRDIPKHIFYGITPSLSLSFHICNMGIMRDFPGRPGVKTLHFHCRGTGSIPGRGTKIPWHGVWLKKIEVLKYLTVILSINHCADGDQHS